MKFSIQTLIWGGVLLALVVAAWLAFIPKPILVEVAEVTKTPLLVSVQEDGKTRIREKYVISAPVAGQLSRVELDAGDEVYGDETLVAVVLPADPSMLDARAKAQAEARVEQARAALKRAHASVDQIQVAYELSENKFKRFEEIKDSRAVSEDEYEVAQAEYLANAQRLKTGEFDVEVASFQLKMAEAALLQFDADGNSTADPFEIHAPISGKVLRVFQESSTVVNVGTPIIEIGDPRELEMEIDVLSTDAVRIPPGADLQVEHWGGKRLLKGHVRVVEPSAFTKISSLGVEEQRVNVIADFDEPRSEIQALGDGYRVEARITVEKQNDVLTVPNSALFRYRREWHVFVSQEGIAKLTPVVIGLQNEERTEVETGLAEGDIVILYPSDEVREGVRVAVAE